MIHVVCKNVKCKFPFSVDPKSLSWSEKAGPLSPMGKPTKLYVAAVRCPTCQVESEQSRSRKP